MTVNFENIPFVISFGERKFIWGMSRTAVEIRRSRKIDSEQLIFKNR